MSVYNITIIASFFMTIFGWFMLPRNARFWLAVLAIVFFTILTGASASVVRASIMGVMVLVARQGGRLYSVKNALVFAGAVMIFLNPKILRFDISFQLSFLATAGLIWLAPVFDPVIQLWLSPKATNKTRMPKLIYGVERWSITQKFIEILVTTFSAQLAVLPLILVYFSQLSLISPLANMAILLLVPFAMLLGFLIGGLGIIWLWGAKVLGWVLWLILTLKIKMIEFFAGLPLSSLEMQWDWIFAIIYYLILTLFLRWFYQRQKSGILVEKYATDN
ncbi:MAG: ComEC/Rec2 family competence protein [Candidatus Portnoybacteria bacterium]|nr:ComEC/Rec2 family competence protein [Candidatus Portnoybacteria bacterium]